MESSLEYWTEKRVDMFQFTLIFKYGFDNHKLVIGKIGNLTIGETKRGGKDIRFLILSNDYEDDYFRFNKSEIDPSFDIAISLGRKYIRAFSPKRMRTKLSDIRSKIQSNEDKTRFGIRYSLVSELVSEVVVSEFKGYDNVTEKFEPYVFTEINKWGKAMKPITISDFISPDRLSNWSETKGKNESCIDDSCKLNIN